MYSKGLIQHEGKVFAPDGAVKAGESVLLDCGHKRPEHDPASFFVPWAIVNTDKGQEEYCLDCCAKLEVEALRVLPKGACYFAYYVNVAEDKRRVRFEIQTWHGQKLMSVFDWNIYQHNFGGRFISISARDIHGNYWHGRASYDNGNCVRLYKNKVQPNERGEL